MLDQYLSGISDRVDLVIFGCELTPIDSLSRQPIDEIDTINTDIADVDDAQQVGELRPHRPRGGTVDFCIKSRARHDVDCGGGPSVLLRPSCLGDRVVCSQNREIVGTNLGQDIQSRVRGNPSFDGQIGKELIGLDVVVVARYPRHR